jgi:hypothetical protein
MILILILIVIFFLIAIFIPFLLVARVFNLPAEPAGGMPIVWKIAELRDLPKRPSFPNERRRKWRICLKKAHDTLSAAAGSRIIAARRLTACGKSCPLDASMANDAKLGLVLGVAIVLVIALVFFRSEPLAAKGPIDSSRQTTALPKDAPADPIDLIPEPSR